MNQVNCSLAQCKDVSLKSLHVRYGNVKGENLPSFCVIINIRWIICYLFESHDVCFERPMFSHCLHVEEYHVFKSDELVIKANKTVITYLIDYPSIPILPSVKLNLLYRYLALMKSR